MYLKTNSEGEFVFDWSWAHAHERCGLKYYPKAVIAHRTDSTAQAVATGTQVHIPAELAAHLAVGMLAKAGLAHKKSEPKPIPARSSLKIVAGRISASSRLGNLAVSASRRILRRFI